MQQFNLSSPHAYEWKRFPDTEAMLHRWIEDGLLGNRFAADLAHRMTNETGTRFFDWVDHLVVSSPSDLSVQLEQAGYHRDWAVSHGIRSTVFQHSGGLFPRVVVSSNADSEVPEIAIKVDNAADFVRAHDLGVTIEGYALGPYRVARVGGEKTTLAAVERRAYRGFEPFDGEMAREGRLAPHSARDALAAHDLWHSRKRRFDNDEQGFDHTEAVLDRVIELCHGSQSLACHLVFEAERTFWQSRNRAAQVQKARQDRLGLGWANHDHHTFRCSRRFFPRVMGIFSRLGFVPREQFHAGAHAGWGAQIVEHPTTSIVIFADLDLSPDETKINFAKEVLPELPNPGTVGLWVGLHGESMLDAGMHHLEAQFDFNALRDQLKSEAAIDCMPPFSDFPFLRQAFTKGECWPVSRARADRLLAIGWIDTKQHQQFLTEGAIGSHLENLQRRDGYKGFNQQAVSAIIEATDPRKQREQVVAATAAAGTLPE